MCLQPCCHGRAIYSFSGAAKYTYRGRTAKYKWYRGFSGTGTSESVGMDWDGKNKQIYASPNYGQIVRYSSVTGTSPTVIATRSPGTSVNQVTQFRVYPDLQQLLFTELINSTTDGTANLLLMPYSGSTPVTLFTFVNRVSTTVGQPVPLSGAINLVTSKVVFTQVALTALAPTTYTLTVKQCDLDGSNLTTLYSFGTYPGMQVQTLVMGDVDYRAGTYLLCESNGYQDSNPRHIYAMPWAGGTPQSLVTKTDVDYYFRRPLAANTFGFYEVQVVDNGRIWFRAYSASTGVINRESHYFSMLSDGSDLRHEIADTDFDDWPGVSPNDRDVVVFGDGMNNRRGRLPA